MSIHLMTRSDMALFKYDVYIRKIKTKIPQKRMKETITWSGHEWLTRLGWGSMHDDPAKRNDCWMDPSQLKITNTGSLLLNIAHNPKTMTLNGVETTANYGAGTISSIQTFGYGTYTICAKMPVGVGLWSAFWLYDNCNPEIDFEMYSMGGDYRKCFLRPYAVETCLHTEPEYELKRFPARAPLFSHFNHDPSAGFHEYTIRWKSNLLEWYIDGVRVRRLKDEKTLRYLQDRKMTAILNTYIDGRYQEKFRINSPMEVRYFIHEKI